MITATRFTKHRVPCTADLVEDTRDYQPSSRPITSTGRPGLVAKLLDVPGAMSALLRTRRSPDACHAGPPDSSSKRRRAASITVNCLMMWLYRIYGKARFSCDERSTVSPAIPPLLANGRSTSCDSAEHQCVVHTIVSNNNRSNNYRAVIKVGSLPCRKPSLIIGLDEAYQSTDPQARPTY